MKEEYDFSNGKRGPVVLLPTGKRRITIGLDEEVIDWFQQEVDARGGGNYQNMINQVLRQYMLSQRERL